MNKGLDALKEYRSQQTGVNVYADEYLDIIEKALKEGEKNKQVLETIKKKIIPLITFTMIKKSGEKNFYYTVGDNWNEDLYLSQEEYDSLKEMFL